MQALFTACCNKVGSVFETLDVEAPLWGCTINSGVHRTGINSCRLIEIAPNMSHGETGKMLTHNTVKGRKSAKVQTQQTIKNIHQCFLFNDSKYIAK